jgi:uncharacterized integral membrane protein (TIGR00697 family)
VEIWGYRKVRLIIWVGFLSNFFVLAFAQVAAWIPSPEFWEGGESFNFIFGLAPRIAIASFAAFLVGSFLNAYVMSRMKIMSKGKKFYLRAILSTLAGETADSLVFFPIALLGLVELRHVIMTMAAEICLKCLYEIVALPITIQFVKYLKKRENTDTFDNDISYNVLKINDI